MRYGLIVVALLSAACGSSSTAPTPAPTPVPTPTLATITGHVTATNGGQPLAGLAVSLAGHSATTDGSGTFSEQTSPVGSTSLLLSGSGIVPRTVTIAASASRDVSVNAIALGSGFDLNFYREMVRNGFEAPGALQPLRRWTRTPQIYLKTVDEGGAAIDGPTLNLIEATVTDMVPRWTSGALGVPVVTRGTDTRVGVSGWITIRFPVTNTVADGNCGQALVGADGGWIELGYHDPPIAGISCRVPGAVIAWRTIRHEIGHALGFWHTDGAADLMYGGTWMISQSNILPSARELAHAAIAYARPVGNSDPDSDPASTVNLAPMSVR